MYLLTEIFTAFFNNLKFFRRALVNLHDETSNAGPSSLFVVLLPLRVVLRYLRNNLLVSIHV